MLLWLKKRKTNISKACDYVNNIVKKKSIVFLLSDFIDNHFSSSVSLLSKKHDVSGIQIFDDFEKNIFNMGLGLFRDLENDTLHWVDTSDESVQTYFNTLHQKYHSYFKKSFLKSGATIRR